MSTDHFEKNNVEPVTHSVAGRVVHAMKTLLHDALVQGKDVNEILSLVNSAEQLEFDLDPLPLIRTFAKRKFSAADLLECIRLMRFVRVSSLAETLNRCLRLSAPASLRHCLTDLLQTRTKPPSRSIIFRYELALDIAFRQTRRKLAKSKAKVRRWGWSDSSPQATYDWLISQCREIPEQFIPDVFHAVISLEHLTQASVAEKVSQNIDWRQIAWEARHTRKPLDVKPEIEWKPFLDIISANVLDHVFTPAAVSSGHRGLADKAAAQMFQWSHECEEGEKESLQTFTDSFFLPLVIWEPNLAFRGYVFAMVRGNYFQHGWTENRQKRISICTKQIPSHLVTMPRPRCCAGMLLRM